MATPLLRLHGIQIWYMWPTTDREVDFDQCRTEKGDQELSSASG